MLYLKEDEIQQLASVPEVVGALEDAFRSQAAGQAFSTPRQRLRMPAATLHMLAGAIPGYFGYKAYTAAGGRARFQFFLFDAASADLLAIMEADKLGQLRTGAATGLATKLLANADATEATLFGAGWQAETQLLAMASVRKLKRVWIVNRDPKRRAEFIARMQPQVEAALGAPASAEDAVRSSQIVTTMTSTREPVVKGEWLQAGQHINAAGGNILLRREVDENAILRADGIVVDSVEQARLEAGEFIAVIESGKKRWADFIELHELMRGRVARSRPGDITFFKSLGIGLEDVAIGKLVYERALARGIGRSLVLQ